MKNKMSCVKYLALLKSSFILLLLFFKLMLYYWYNAQILWSLATPNEGIWGHGSLTMSLFQTKSHTCEAIWGAGQHNMGITSDSWSWLLCPVGLVSILFITKESLIFKCCVVCEEVMLRQLLLGFSLLRELAGDFIPCVQVDHEKNEMSNTKYFS